MAISGPTATRRITKSIVDHECHSDGALEMVEIQRGAVSRQAAVPHSSLTHFLSFPATHQQLKHCSLPTLSVPLIRTARRVSVKVVIMPHASVCLCVSKLVCVHVFVFI